MILIILTVTLVTRAVSYPAPCTDDSQCPSGFFCEDSSHICRECLLCGQYQRQPQPQTGSCVKTVVQCGPCSNGYDNVNGNCEGGNGWHAYLPPYAWVALAVGLLLMFVTLALLLVTKAFKVLDYSSCTSVQSLRAADGTVARRPSAPPPYNAVLPTAFPLSPVHADAPEITRLVDPVESCKRPYPESPTAAAREPSANQAARVFSHPAYVRLPQDINRCKTPDEQVSPVDSEDPNVIVSQSVDIPDTTESTGPNHLKSENAINQTVLEGETNYEFVAHGNGKDQDSNNNGASPGGSQGEHSADVPRRAAYVIGGPSFVINVVENINNVGLRSETNCHQFNPS